MVFDPYGNEKAGFTVTGKIDRTDWELSWNTVVEKTGVMVSNEISIVCEIELTNLGKENLTMSLEHEAERESKS